MNARKSMLVFSLLWLIACGAVAGTPSTTPQHHSASGYLGPAPFAPKRFHDLHELLAALAQGERARVQQFANKLQLNALTRRMLQAQLAYDMRGLLSTAQACRHKTAAEGAIAAAMRCAAIAYGTASVLGDAKQGLRALAWLKTVGCPRYLSGGAKPPRLSTLSCDSLSLMNISKPASAVAPLDVHVGAQRASLPIVNWTMWHGAASSAHSTHAWTSPQVEIRVNGHKLRALVDTGSSPALTIDASHARGLGMVQFTISKHWSRA